MLQEAAVNAMIPITDLAQARAFYGGTLGLQAREESGGAGPSDCGGRSWVLLYETMPDGHPRTHGDMLVSRRHPSRSRRPSDPRVEFVEYDLPGATKQGAVAQLEGVEKGA